MSSVPRIEILRSATFRRAATYFGLLWLVLAAGICVLAHRVAEQGSGNWWLEAVDSVNDQAEWVVGVLWDRKVAMESGRVVDPWDEEDEGEDWDDGEGEASEDREDEDREDDEEHEEALDLIPAKHVWKWLGDPASVAFIFDDKEEDEEPACWRVVGGSGKALGNVSPEIVFEPKSTASRLTSPEDDGEDEPSLFVAQVRLLGNQAEGLCVAQRHRLDDGSEVILGLLFPSSAARGAGLALWLQVWLGLLIAGFGAGYAAYDLARGPKTLSFDLERARYQIELGKLSYRLRQGHYQGDLAAAVDSVNSVLDRLDRAVSTLSQVTNNIAHDLRTPLTRLQAQLDLVRRNPSPTPEMIEVVQDEAGQLMATFNALLRIAQVESGSRRHGFRVFDLTRVVADVADLYEPVMADKGIRFSCQAPEKTVQLHGDPDLWMQALSNLLDNALKYTPAEGQVRLQLVPGDLHRNLQSEKPIEIRLQDSGSGIPEAELNKVFQRFYRVSTHRKEKGNGLGLTLVAAICELHQAKIRLENRSGLSVLVTIPPYTSSTGAILLGAESKKRSPR